MCNFFTKIDKFLDICKRFADNIVNEKGYCTNLFLSLLKIENVDKKEGLS